MHTSFGDLRGHILIMDEDGTPTVLPPRRDFYVVGLIWAVTACPLGFAAGWLVGRFIN